MIGGFVDDIVLQNKVCNKTFSSAKMAKCAKSPSRIVYWFIPCYTNTLELIRNQCVPTLLWGRGFTDNAERLLFSYRSVYAEARIYTRRFGCKCELVCKKLNKREEIYSKKRDYANFHQHFFNDSESASERDTDVT